MNNNFKVAKRVSIITILGNIFLSIFKILAGFLGKSTSMVADGFHSLSDIVTTVMVLIGIKISGKKADEEHPYGHEKFEPEFSKIISILLIITGGIIGIEAFNILIKGEYTKPLTIAVVAAITSIAVKEAMYWYTLFNAKKIKSIAMEADAWHHRADAMSSVATLFGIVGARMGYGFLDPLAGIFVSILIIKVGVQCYLKATKELVDQCADKVIIEQIEFIAKNVKGVENIKELKTRKFGNRVYADMDILVEKTLTVEEGHEIAKLVHDKIEEKVESVKHCMIHIEPY